MRPAAGVLREATPILSCSDLYCSWSVQTAPLTFRYFACRGRGQALRFFLADSGVPWTNVVVPLSSDKPEEWKSAKGKAAETGPFGTVPTLELPAPSGVVFNEVLAIAAYVSRHGASASADDASWATSLSVASKCHLDITVPLSGTALHNAQCEGAES